MPNVLIDRSIKSNSFFDNSSICLDESSIVVVATSKFSDPNLLITIIAASEYLSASIIVDVTGSPTVLEDLVFLPAPVL